MAIARFRRREDSGSARTDSGSARTISSDSPRRSGSNDDYARRFTLAFTIFRRAALVFAERIARGTRAKRTRRTTPPFVATDRGSKNYRTCDYRSVKMADEKRPRAAFKKKHSKRFRENSGKRSMQWNNRSRRLLRSFLVDDGIKSRLRASWIYPA